MPFHGEVWWQNPETSSHKCHVAGSSGSQVELSWPLTSRILINAVRSYQQSEIGVPTQANPRRIEFLAMTARCI